MLWRHEVRAPAGHEVAVNGELSTRRPLYVGRYEQVHFVSFAPAFVAVAVDASSQEGIVFQARAHVRIELHRTALAELLRSAGHATYRNPMSASAASIAKAQNLDQSLGAITQTFIRGEAFFDLADHAQAKSRLGQLLTDECARARLVGQLVGIELVPRLPDEDLLAQLRARATTQSSLAPLVQHFREAIVQRHVLEAETERAKTESTKARADRRIIEGKEEDRVASSEAALQEQATERQRSGQARNAAIQETNAQYEFVYKAKRLDEERLLAEKRIEVANIEDLREAGDRQRRKLDFELQLERERQRAAIRVDERLRTLNAIAEVVGRLQGMPQPNYQGVHTLVTSGPDSSETFSALLWNVLSKFTDGQGLGQLVGTGAPEGQS